MITMRYLAGWMMVVALLLSVTALPHTAMAAQGSNAPAPGAVGDHCTDFERLGREADDGTPGILTNITDFVKPVVADASQKLFSAFTTSSAYQSAVNAAATLMIIIYGVSFTMGIVQPSFAQALVRLMKLAIIYAIISDSGWQFFSQYAVTFFNDGTDELIRMVMDIGVDNPLATGTSPFRTLDGIAKIIVSPEMIIASIGATTAPSPFGMLVGGLMIVAVGGFLKLLLKGLETYAISFILRAMLLGVAPIFIVFLMFDKTKQLFTGWLNSMINLSLKPILYFTFISFFVVMMQGASKDMLGGAELCWTTTAGLKGTPNKMSGWRFVTPGQTAPSLDVNTWKGPLQCVLDGKKDCKDFPINILDVLTFLILVYVAQKFAGVVDQVANDIASVAINLSTDTKHTFNQSAPSGKTVEMNPNAAKAKPRTK